MCDKEKEGQDGLEIQQTKKTVIERKRNSVTYPTKSRRKMKTKQKSSWRENRRK